MRALAAAIAMLVLLVTSVALAQGKPAPETRRAKALFEEGIALSDEGKWAEALEAFEKSNELVPSPTVQFNIGVTLRALGRYVEAKNVLDGILAAADNKKVPLKPALVAEIKKVLADVYDKIVALTVVLDPPDAKLEVDGAPPKPLPDGRIELDPGRHVFVVSAPGHETTTVTKTLTPDDTEILLKAPKSVAPKVVEKPVPARKEEPPLYERAWFWTTAGAIVAGAVIVTIIATRPDARDPAAPPPSTVDRVIPAGARF